LCHINKHFIINHMVYIYNYRKISIQLDTMVNLNNGYLIMVMEPTLKMVLKKVDIHLNLLIDKLLQNRLGI